MAAWAGLSPHGRSLAPARRSTSCGRIWALSATPARHLAQRGRGRWESQANPSLSGNAVGNKDSERIDCKKNKNQDRETRMVARLAAMLGNRGAWHCQPEIRPLHTPEVEESGGAAGQSSLNAFLKTGKSSLGRKTAGTPSQIASTYCALPHRSETGQIGARMLSSPSTSTAKWTITPFCRTFMHSPQQYTRQSTRVFLLPALCLNRPIA